MVDHWLISRKLLVIFVTIPTTSAISPSLCSHLVDLKECGGKSCHHPNNLGRFLFITSFCMSFLCVSRSHFLTLFAEKAKQKPSLT
jgi:hypothetical protein